MVRGATGVAGPVNPGWFAIAVQALVVLAGSEGVCPSAAIAGELRSHAVFLRRVLAGLARARIVEAREGRDGGYRLARPADEVTLAEVYRAVEAAAPAELDPSDGGPGGEGCALGAAMGAAFAEIVAETEDAILAVLGRHTVGELAARAARTPVAPGCAGPAVGTVWQGTDTKVSPRHDRVMGPGGGRPCD